MLGAVVSWAVGEVELVTWMGAVGVIGGANWCIFVSHNSSTMCQL